MWVVHPGTSALPEALAGPTVWAMCYLWTPTALGALHEGSGHMHSCSVYVLVPPRPDPEFLMTETVFFLCPCVSSTQSGQSRWFFDHRVAAMTRSRCHNSSLGPSRLLGGHMPTLMLHGATERFLCPPTPSRLSRPYVSSITAKWSLLGCRKDYRGWRWGKIRHNNTFFLI